MRFLYIEVHLFINITDVIQINKYIFSINILTFALILVTNIALKRSATVKMLIFYSSKIINYIKIHTYEALSMFLKHTFFLLHIIIYKHEVIRK